MGQWLSYSTKNFDHLEDGEEYEFSPELIRFCQNEIFHKFQARLPHEMKKLTDVLKDLYNGRERIDNFPKITVTVKNDMLFSLDNRRLWIFKEYQKKYPSTKIQVRFCSSLCK